MQVLNDIFFIWFVALHYSLTILFFICFARFLFARYAPYSGFYVASIFFVQSIYNGCPFTEAQNWLAAKAGRIPDANEFMFGGFNNFPGLGDINLTARFVFLLLSIIIFRYSYRVWAKPTVVVNFNRCFKHFS